MISLNWVKDYIDIEDQEPRELARKITEAGINIEEVKTQHIDNLVIGQIKEVVDHPDSDHLHVCKVDVGKETKQIVCGAPNVAEKLKVIVALPGAVLPGDFEIKKSKIRGVESDGMLCALFELGLEEKNDETYAKGITELDKDAPIGKNPLAYLGLDDTTYELDIHKHRNNDCYYHIGFAYEIACILNRKVKLPELDFKPVKDKMKFNLKIDTKKCNYFLAREVRNVKIGESPDFIKKRLIAAGMRPINNVVDISNYVMLEFGQPLHFYDKDKLGDTILVRDAKENEEMISLDCKKRILSSDDIVITDGKKPVYIAGVMGGENTEVDENTKNILIESAIFDPVSIRYTSRKLELPNEASIRYGKGLCSEYTEMANRRACNLLEKYADAEILDGYELIDTEEKIDKKVKFKAEDVNKVLGINISIEDMEKELNRLDFPYKLNKDVFEVNIPSRRLDIDPNVNDIAEEIGRLNGYNNLVSSLPIVETRRGEYVEDVKYRKLVSKRLRTLGLNEVKTYTLVSEEMSKLFDYESKSKIFLPNPMSKDKCVIRTTLIPSLLNVYNYNKTRGVEDINIYEIAKTYDTDYKESQKIAILMSGNYLVNDWQNTTKVDFYLVKGILENLLDYMGYSNRYSLKKAKYDDFHPGICGNILLDNKKIGVIGKINPAITKDDIYIIELNLESIMYKTPKLAYKESLKFPSIEKDLSFILNKDIEVIDIINTIKHTANKTLQDVKVFDVYQGEKIDKDKKSIAFNLLFNGINRTLTDEEVMIEFNKIIKEVEKAYKAELRDK